MRFINFTQHNMTPEQIKAAQEMGATQIINVESHARFNDDGVTPAWEIAEKIAREIAQIITPNEVNIIHFPISSPRVMAAFFHELGYCAHTGDGDPTYAQYDPVWNTIVQNCKFVFSHSDRESVDVAQSDGSVFKGFLEF